MTGIAAKLVEYMPTIGDGIEFIQKLLKAIFDAINEIIKFLTVGMIDVNGFLADIAGVGRKYAKELDKKNLGFPGVFDVGNVLGVDAGAKPLAMPSSGGGDNFNWNW